MLKTPKLQSQNIKDDHYENTPIQIYWKNYHQKKIKIFR